MVKVLDACALTLYLEKEPGYEQVKSFFVKAAESEKDLLMAAINWGEVYYVLIRDHGRETADEILRLIKTYPIDVVSVDTDLTRQAALYKVMHKLPFADCFAAALAKLRKAELVTADRDFKAVEGDIKIFWI